MAAGREREGSREWRRWTAAPTLAALLLGFSSGLPLALTASTLTFRMAEAGVDKGTVGLFALVGIAYGWKFVWSPAVDRLPLPGLSRRLGRRRAWLLLTQLALLVGIFALGRLDPAREIGAVAFWAVLVAFFSASQDIVVDAYRAESAAPGTEGAAAGAYVMGYRVALLLASAGALSLAAWLGWPAAYGIMAALMLVGLLTTLAGREPPAAILRDEPAPAGLARRLRRAVIEPLAEFFGRNGAAYGAAVLGFILFYKLGDAMLATMTSPFYVEAGFSKTEVAEVAKIFGFGATLAGGFLGGLVVDRRGVLGGLWICGLLQMASNLVYVAQAWAGHHLGMLALTITVEQVAGGMGTAAFVAYLMSLCDLRYTATQYALMSSAMAQARTTLSAASGFLAAAMSWPAFFLVTALASLPGLALLLVVQRGAAATPGPVRAQDPDMRPA